MLLKKIESLESKVKVLAQQWKELKEENARLLQEKDRLMKEASGLTDKLNRILGERSEEESESAIKPDLLQAIDACIAEMEEGLELLRQDKNGI